MDMKLVSFILLFTSVLLEAKPNLWRDLPLSQNIINYLFPKDPNILRVRNPNEVITQVNNVTTLDFVSVRERLK